MPSVVHKRNQHYKANWHQNSLMRNIGRAAIPALLLAFCAARAQDDISRPGQDSHLSAATQTEPAKVAKARKAERALNSDERLAVIASALDSKTPRFSERDCSHMVHAIYQRAGFPYSYVDSDQLYDGVEGFQRVSRPETGDLVVWHGHVGIVIRPSRHVFFSFLHAGPGIDDYENRYWRARGQARFFRYIKNDRCAGCMVARRHDD